VTSRLDSPRLGAAPPGGRERSRPPLRRDPRRGLFGGEVGGIAERLRMDPTLLRVLFVIATVASSGILLLAYVVAWAVIPARDGSPALRPLPRPQVRSDWRVAVGVGLLTLSVLLVFRQLGIWWSDALVWPLVLIAFAAAVLWGRSRSSASEPAAGERAWAAAGAPAARVDGAVANAGIASQAKGTFGELYRGVFGVLLVIGAVLLVLSSNHIFGGLRDAALTAVVVIVAVAMILAPFLWRLGRNLAAERAERVRSEERAELAAHLHDSVLQTLTLMQKRADDPREVASLARRQERELREWLAGGDAPPGSFAAALRAAAEAIEDDHRVAVDVVVVGDCEMDERAEAVLGAAREALLNAAKHAPEPGPIRVYAEVRADRMEAFVRDRGDGYDPAAAPADRRGGRESINGRMERAGGRAEVHSTPGHGTEVSLEIGRPAGGTEAEGR
jgi:signal transduction histidine kinase/phage shock protein PspC (stress-responsive transcriptional regulator)